LGAACRRFLRVSSYYLSNMQRGIVISCLLVQALGAPAPQVTSYGLDSQVPAIATAPPSSGQPGAAPPRVSSDVTGVTSHGPFSGTPTTTGAVKNSPLAASIPALGPNPTATYYNAQGVLLEQEPAPYTPKGESNPEQSPLQNSS
jgi:hypothetical protein